MCLSAQEEATISEIIRTILPFPRFINEDKNLDLMAKVSKDGLKTILQSFQKDKSLGPDGWGIEFFLGLYNVLAKDLLLVVEESGRDRYILLALNSTFITLIVKVDSPCSFDDFRPISLCNVVYKVITKVISLRLKLVLSASISKEQLGFLKVDKSKKRLGWHKKASIA